MSRSSKSFLALLFCLALLVSSGLASAEVVQDGTLRVSVDGKLSPRKLPRTKVAPIAVSVSWKMTTTDKSQPPNLKTLRIEINRNGHFDSTGLPVCPFAKIQPASTARALANCRSALVGQGHFTAEIALGSQEPYAAQGRLLVFNGRSHGKPVLFGQIYSAHPFATSFVIIFELKKLARGSYGTALTATLPKALASWGNLTAIDMTLARRYSYGGKRHSFLSARCAAPAGFSLVAFPLARTIFTFAGDVTVRSTLTRSCRARR